MFVHDLTMLDQGNENWVEQEKGIMNFEKWEMLGNAKWSISLPALGKQLINLNLTQQAGYHFVKVRVIQKYLKNLSILEPAILRDLVKKSKEKWISDLPFAVQ